MHDTQIIKHSAAQTIDKTKHQRITQTTPKGPQSVPKMKQWGPKRPPFWPQLSHLGAEVD